MNWGTLDLNLLRVLDTMLYERNTTRAGERLGLSQPAVSAALTRLRGILGDALFVREGNKMVPTPFAASIGDPLRQALGRIELVLAGNAPFAPAKSTRLIRMLGDDYLAEMVLPKILTLLLECAPGIRFQLLPTNPRPLALQLAEDGIDLAFGIIKDALPEWVVRVLAMHAAPTPVASRSNRYLARAGIEDRHMIPLDLFCEMPQVFFGPDGMLVGEEDAALAGIGRKRNVVATVPDFFSVARVVAQTDLLALLPDRFALSVADVLGLRIYSLPFQMPVVPLHLCWHKRHDDDPEHRWIRELILEQLEPLDAIRYPVSFAPAETPRG
ncbi:LysR family transcriptional regulator [Kaistia terrae]|uniref:LysR family transcriptional regulator n=1 Tax=Kaistia terrae TaxID=537017 RepID=A0ABW0PZ27_9HYPH|nr:LysR family transcriptional regulator [Kaistia terrae]MCX5580898.1 LysR family transcriptional regulator [Kaistia terrae]